jgi:hypothetical protein
MLHALFFISLLSDNVTSLLSIRGVTISVLNDIYVISIVIDLTGGQNQRNQLSLRCLLTWNTCEFNIFY